MASSLMASCGAAVGAVAGAAAVVYVGCRLLGRLTKAPPEPKLFAAECELKYDSADRMPAILGLNVKTIGYLFGAVLLAHTLGFGAMYHFSGWARARWYLSAVLISLHQVEEYVLSSWALGDDYLFLNWIQRAGFYIPIRFSIFANQVLPWVVIGLSLVCYDVPKLQLATLYLHTWLMALQANNGAYHYGCWHQMMEFSPGQITGMYVYIPWFVYLSYVLVAEYGTPLWVPWAMWTAGGLVHFKMIAMGSIKSPNHWQWLVARAGGEIKNPIDLRELKS